MKAVKKTNISGLLNVLSKEGTVYIPAEDEDATKYVPWQSDVKPALEHNAIFSPKGVLFPQTETMYKYQFGAENSAAPAPGGAGKIIVFGIRPCDVQAIRCLDEVFLTKGYADTYYKEKRDRLVLISLGCTQAEDTCFCNAMGVNAAEADGADVVLFDLGEEYGIEEKTKVGSELMRQAASQLAESSQKKPQPPSFSLQVNTEGIVEKLQQMFEHPIWSEVSQKCIGCGACTFLCPTCHCFDINSKNTADHEGFKYRTWDACMFCDYALMAGGHDPRPTKKERVRNRYLHKLQFFQERYGMYLCTGCGRCLRECPVGMNIAGFINQLGEVTVNV